jgi:hypothetical protein
MTTSDYIIDLALIGVVFLQIRGRRLTARALFLPVALVAWAASQFLKSIPTAGNDLVLIAACTAAGLLLGGLSGMLTRVEMGEDGHVWAKAGLAAAVLWVLGVGFRFAFQLFATHGGGLSIVRFSIEHSITTNQAWVAALVLMAIMEALARTAVLAWRAFVLGAASRPAPAGMISVGDRLI